MRKVLYLACAVVLTTTPAIADPIIPGVSSLSITSDGVAVNITDELANQFIQHPVPAELAPKVSVNIRETEFSLFMVITGGDIVVTDPSQSETFNLMNVLKYWNGSYVITQRGVATNNIGFPSREVDNVDIGGALWHRAGYPVAHHHPDDGGHFTLTGALNADTSEYQSGTKYESTLSKELPHDEHIDSWKATLDMSIPTVSESLLLGNIRDITTWTLDIEAHHPILDSDKPEPRSAFLLGTGLAALAIVVARQKRQKRALH